MILNSNAIFDTSSIKKWHIIKQMITPQLSLLCLLISFPCVPFLIQLLFFLYFVPIDLNKEISTNLKHPGISQPAPEHNVKQKLCTMTENMVVGMHLPCIIGVVFINGPYNTNQWLHNWSQRRLNWCRHPENTCQPWLLLLLHHHQCPILLNTLVRLLVIWNCVVTLASHPQSLAMPPSIMVSIFNLSIKFSITKILKGGMKMINNVWNSQGSKLNLNVCSQQDGLVICKAKINVLYVTKNKASRSWKQCSTFSVKVIMLSPWKPSSIEAFALRGIHWLVIQCIYWLEAILFKWYESTMVGSIVIGVGTWKAH